MRNTYFLLRHGETPQQLKKEITLYPWPEPSPILLTEKGKKQIKAVAEKLKQEGIDLIFASDRPRTKQTAEIIAKELGLEVIFDPRLREINFGVFAGRLEEELRKFYGEAEQRFIKRPLGGENWADVKKRVVDFIEEIDKDYKGEKILIISHGDPLWLLYGAIKGLSNQELFEKKHSHLYLNVGQFHKLET